MVSTEPALQFISGEAWAAWLAEHHDSSEGVWLRIAKVAAGAPSVTYSEALDVALCYGWIDGQKDRLDGEAWLQRFTPRRGRSRWSKANTERVGRLLEQGRLQPSGLREVEAARADGRWEAAYDGQRSAQTPEDLQRALDLDDRARSYFAGLDSANRYAILYRIQDAKKPETRARRIEKFVAMLRAGQKLHP